MDSTIKTLNDLIHTISLKTKNLPVDDADWERIQILLPYALELGQILRSGETHQQSAQFIENNLFYLWLNRNENNRLVNESNFMTAKNDLIKCGLASAQPYALEYICAEIFLFYRDKKILSQVPARKEDHETLLKHMTSARDKMEQLGTIYFDNEILHHLLRFCLDELLIEQERNVYSSGKTHKNIPREIMVKYCILLLNELFWTMNLSNEFVANISITIAAHFFNQPMELKDAKALADQIKKCVSRSKEMRDKTIYELLHEHSIKKYAPQSQNT